jgi:hypothetical protein
VRIKEIILSSAHHSVVSGIDEASVRITRRGLGTAYDEPTIKVLTPKLKEVTGLNAKSFQALYRGFEFTVR